LRKYSEAAMPGLIVEEMNRNESGEFFAVAWPRLFAQIRDPKSRLAHREDEIATSTYYTWIGDVFGSTQKPQRKRNREQPARKRPRRAPNAVPDQVNAAVSD
jgi:hypothetical protein